MDQEKLLYFKGLLEGRLHDLVEEAGKTCSDMRQENDGDFPDPTDRASLESDRNFLLRIKDRERKLIQKVKEALDRIDNGDLWHLRLLRKAYFGKETDGQTGHHLVHRMQDRKRGSRTGRATEGDKVKE